LFIAWYLVPLPVPIFRELSGTGVGAYPYFLDWEIRFGAGTGPEKILADHPSPKKCKDEFPGSGKLRPQMILRKNF